MDFTATIKFLRTSPRKLRLVGRSLKGQEVAKSLIFLSQINKRAAKTLFKAVKSATANAKSKGLEEKDLKIKNVIIEGGPVFKRFQPVSRGQAHPITKRTSHIKVILEGEQGGKIPK